MGLFGKKSDAVQASVVLDSKLFKAIVRIMEDATGSLRASRLRIRAAQASVSCFASFALNFDI